MNRRGFVDGMLAAPALPTGSALPIGSTCGAIFFDLESGIRGDDAEKAEQ